MPLSEFRALAAATLASGNPLRELTAAFDAFARSLALPAALLDAGMVFLALNGPYARMVGLPPSALVGKDYSKVHRNRQDILNILQANRQGETRETELAEPIGAGDGVGYRRRSVTPLKNADGQVLGMLLEYHHGVAPSRDAQD